MRLIKSSASYLQRYLIVLVPELLCGSLKQLVDLVRSWSLFSRFGLEGWCWTLGYQVANYTVWFDVISEAISWSCRSFFMIWPWMLLHTMAADLLKLGYLITPFDFVLYSWFLKQLVNLILSIFFHDLALEGYIYSKTYYHAWSARKSRISTNYNVWFCVIELQIR